MNKFQTVIGGYDDNEAVRNHMWDVLVPAEESTPAPVNQLPTPPLHHDWLTPPEQCHQED